MKKFLILFLLFILCTTVTAGKFDYGATVPIKIITMDPATAEPVAPDSIQITIYYEMGTTAVVATTAMTQWNSQTGEYYYNFTVPDSGGTYNARINWGDAGDEFVIWMPNLEATAANIFAGILPGYKEINIEGEDADTTLFIRTSGPDTVVYQEYWHKGKTSNDPPDSTIRSDWN